MAYTPWSGVTAAEVKIYSQITDFKTLGFANDTAYETWIRDEILAEIEGFICGFCSADFSASFSSLSSYRQNELKGIVKRIVSNALQVAVKFKTGGIVRIADWDVDFTNRNILTDELKARLRKFQPDLSCVKASDYKTSNIYHRWETDEY